MQIVVVDDDVAVHMMFELGLDDIEVVEAYSLQEGFELGVADASDAFVIDRRIRDHDGLELVRRLRQDLRTNRKPIVVLSAWYDPAEEAEVLQAGADVYLPKPFSPESVSEQLRAVMGIAPQLRRERRAAGINRLQLGGAPEPLMDLRDDARTMNASGTDQAGRRRWRHRRVESATANR